MIRSVLALRAKDGLAGALEDLYRDQRVLEISRAFPGCRGATLWRTADDGRTTHLVIADWDGPDDYARWVADPFRRRTSVRLAELLDLEPDEQILGGLFSPVPDGTPPDTTGVPTAGDPAPAPSPRSTP